MGGLFAPEQLPQSKSWPALEFMAEQVQTTRFSILLHALVSCMQVHVLHPQNADWSWIYSCVLALSSESFVCACTRGVSFILYCTCSVGLAYEMTHPAESPWKPLICNFSPSYDNFLQVQSSEELERATAEISIANPHWNATKVIEKEVSEAAVNIHGIFAAVVALFPDIFPSDLSAKVFIHAHMAVISRAWGMDGQYVLCPIADLFNHEEPTHVVISIQKSNKIKQEGPLDTVEVVLKRSATQEGEIFNGARLFCILRLSRFSQLRCSLRKQWLHTKIRLEFR
jgi:hypothetical protein